jgi:hypothetical protein
MRQLGLDEHAKKNAKCPFHDDGRNSFSVFQGEGSAWFWKCHSGCGQGDEITFLEKHEGISNVEAITVFCAMAGCAPVNHLLAPRRNSSKRANNANFDWQECVDALSERNLERLGNARFLSPAFCSWLYRSNFIGQHNGRVAFPNGNGTVVGAHVWKGGKDWYHYPSGVGAHPFVIGDLSQAKQVHLFESQWDMLAFADRSGNYEAEGVVFVATRGARNAGLIRDLLPEGASVLAWPQNDTAGESWLSGLSAFVPKLGVARVPVSISKLNEFGDMVALSIKDMNDWTKAGASAEDIYAAFFKNELYKPQTESAAVGPSVAKTENPCAPVQLRPLSELLDAIRGFVRRYVVFQFPEQASVISLWAVHTWTLKAFDYTPYLNVFAASKRSGKSRVLEVLGLLCRNPRLTSGGSSAALIRSVNEENPPTILLDEVDAIYSKKNDTEAENTRQFLNAGYRRGASFLRCVGQSAAIEVKEFPAFCPKAFAGIGRCLPDTVLDRSLPIELMRQSREEKAERFREREARAAVAPLRAELEVLSQQPGICETLREARPILPEELNDRAQDICEPLLVIADLAGGDWPYTTRTGLVKLCSQEEDTDIVIRLLAAIKSVFDNDEEGADRLTTQRILDALVAIEDGPWASMFEDALKHDKLNSAASRLARLLKGYKIKPCKIRIGDETAKGYYRSQFLWCWERLLPPSSPLPLQAGTKGTVGTNPEFTRQNSCSQFLEQSVNVHTLPKKVGTQFYERQTLNVPCVHPVHT